MAKLSKKVKAARELVERTKLYTLDEALEILKKATEGRKIKETVEIALNLGVDPKYADQMVRGMVELPNGTGATVRVGVFARDAKAEEAKKAGADVVGAEDLLEAIMKGEINFDRCIATPDMMPIVGRAGKILGPRGLMPNPKLGTVTPDVAKAVESAKGGAVEFRVEKAGIVHAGVGKITFESKDLKENIIAFVDAIQKARPSGAKGTYMKKITLSSTMGPGIKIDMSEFAKKEVAA